MSITIRDIGKLFGQVNDGDFTLKGEGEKAQLERVNRGSSSFTRAIFFKQKNLSDGVKNIQTREAIFKALTKGEENKAVIDKIRDSLGLNDENVKRTPLKCRVVANLLSVKSAGVAFNPDQTIKGFRAAGNKANPANAEVKRENVEKAPEQNNDIKLDIPQVKYRDGSEVVADLGEIKIDRPNYHTVVESVEKLSKSFLDGLNKLDESFKTVMDETKPAFEGKKFGELYPNVKEFCANKNSELRLKFIQDEIKLQENLNQLKELNDKINAVKIQIADLEGDLKTTKEELTQAKSEYNQLKKFIIEQRNKPEASPEAVKLMQPTYEALRTKVLDLQKKEETIDNQIAELTDQNRQHDKTVGKLREDALKLQRSIGQQYSEYINSCQKTLKDTFMNVDTNPQLAEELKSFEP